MIAIIDGSTLTSLSLHHDAGKNNAVGGNVVSGNGVNVDLGSLTCPHGPGDTVQTEMVQKMQRGKFLHPPLADGGFGAGGAPGAAAAVVIGTSSRKEAQLPKPLPMTAVVVVSRLRQGETGGMTTTRGGQGKGMMRIGGNWQAGEGWECADATSTMEKEWMPPAVFFCFCFCRPPSSR